MIVLGVRCVQMVVAVLDKRHWSVQRLSRPHSQELVRRLPTYRALTLSKIQSPETYATRGGGSPRAGVITPTASIYLGPPNPTQWLGLQAALHEGQNSF